MSEGGNKKNNHVISTDVNGQQNHLLLPTRNGSQASNLAGETKIDMKEETYLSSQEDLKRLQQSDILKRIPENSEATTVLVSIGYFSCHFLLKKINGLKKVIVISDTIDLHISKEFLIFSL